MDKIKYLKLLSCADFKTKFVMHFIILPFSVFVVLYTFKALFWLGKKFYGSKLSPVIKISSTVCAFTLIAGLITGFVF